MGAEQTPMRQILGNLRQAAATADARTSTSATATTCSRTASSATTARRARASGTAPSPCAAAVPTVAPPPITEGARFVMRDVPGEPVLICADSIGMLQPDDAGRIIATASHGALSGGRPNGAVPLDWTSTRCSSAMPAAAWTGPGGHEAEGLHRGSDCGSKAITRPSDCVAARQASRSFTW
jgi:hypothetical protein